MSQSNFFDALKQIMNMDKDGTYSSFKELPKVSDPMFTPEQYAGVAQAFGQMSGGVQGPQLGNVHRGGGVVSLMPHTLEGPKTIQDFTGILQSLGKDNEEMLGLLSLFQK